MASLFQRMKQEVAEFLNSLSQEEIDKMASTYTEGYRIGFITGRKDITKRKQ